MKLYHLIIVGLLCLLIGAFAGMNLGQRFGSGTQTTTIPGNLVVGGTLTITTTTSQLVAQSVSSTNGAFITVTSTNWLTSSTSTFGNNLGSILQIGRSSVTSTIFSTTGTCFVLVTPTGTRVSYVPIGGGAFSQVTTCQ